MRVPIHTLVYQLPASLFRKILEGRSPHYPQSSTRFP
jgi:hypothetical protein